MEKSWNETWGKIEWLVSDADLKKQAEGQLQCGADVNAKDNNGWTPLHRAACVGATKTVEKLIEAGADVNAKDNGDWTPLHCAARDNCCVETVEKLIEKGADVNAEEKGGITALHIAVYNHHMDIARTLIEAGANIKENGDQTLLDTIYKESVRRLFCNVRRLVKAVSKRNLNMFKSIEKEHQ